MIDEDQDCFDFVYKKNDGQQVTGYQVGRFAIRYVGEGGVMRDARGHQRPIKPWLVDHWPSGFAVRDAKDFHEANVIADCVSIFSEKDPDTKNVRELASQFGPLVTMWIQWMEENDGRVVDFREWAKAYEIAGQRSEQDYDAP